MIDEILNAYGARFVIAAGGVFLALVVLIIVLWIIRNKAPSPFVRGGRSRQPRLQVLDAAAVDTRRRLVLVRRDNIEHLILIGGPTDIVIESGIGEPKTYLAGELAANTALEQHEAAETPLPRQEPAALQTPPAELQAEPQASKPVVPPRREVRKEAPALDLIMPTETPAPTVNPEKTRPEQPVARVQPKAPPAPEPAREIIPEPVRAKPPQSAMAPAAAEPIASAARPAPTPVPPSVPAAPPPLQQPAQPQAQQQVQPPAPARPAPPVSVSEPVKAEAPEVFIEPTAVQTPPPVHVEDAALVLDAARERILPPKVEPFPADRFQAPVEPVEIPAKVDAPARVDPDMDSIKSEFEKILDTEVLNQPAPTRPRPTVEPPITRSLPVMDVSPTVKQPAPANSSAPAAEGNLQNEIARIFGEMGAPRKD